MTKIKPMGVGRGPPQHPRMAQGWLNRSIATVNGKSCTALKPVLQEFQELIEGDVTLKVLASLMFNEIPQIPPYDKDPNMEPQARDYKHMLQLLDRILESAPRWDSSADQAELGGFPISAILTWPMNTYSGNAFFLRKDVNEQLARILGKWAEYMRSADSVSVLTDAADGWLSENAISAITVKGNNGTSEYTFDQLYVCDPTAPHYGFTSWDDFFTRQLREGVRPLNDECMRNSIARRATLKDGAFIYNACESCPVFLRRGDDVHKSAPFWLKGQAYSLSDMLDHDELAPQFIGGTVYQAYLSTLSYHRWHSPVSGTIVKAFKVPGTYYSANYFYGFANTADGPDPIAPGKSQAYTTAVAARAVIFIEADDARIGLMAFLAVGMCEVSSNDVTVGVGQRVSAGDQLGMFHYGGSTHCLLFRRGVDVVFVLEPNDGTGYDPPPEHNFPVRSAIAMVT